MLHAILPAVFTVAVVTFAAASVRTWAAVRDALRVTK